MSKEQLILIEGSTLLQPLVMLYHLPVALLTGAAHDLLLGSPRCPGTEDFFFPDVVLLTLDEPQVSPQISPSHSWGVNFRRQRYSLSLEIYFSQESTPSIFFRVILGVTFDFLPQAF